MAQQSAIVQRAQSGALVVQRAWRVLRALASVLGVYAVSKLVRFIRFREAMNRRFDGPPASTLFGNLGDLAARGGLHQAFLLWVHEGRGDLCRFWVGPRLNLSVMSGEGAQEVLRKAIRRPDDGALDFLGSTSLLHENDPRAAKRLRLCYGALVGTQEALQRVHECAIQRFSRNIRPWGKADVHLFDALGPMSQDVVGRVLFGEAWEAHGKFIHQAYTWLLESDGEREMGLKRFAPRWLDREYSAVRKQLVDLCSTILDEHAERVQANPKRYEMDRAPLTVLVRQGEDPGRPALDRREAVSALLSLFHGAAATTQSSLFWLLDLLARHQDVQNKLHEEIVDNVGRRLGPTLADTKELPFLDAVIQESLRLRCTVPLVRRCVGAGEGITLQGIAVPGGTHVTVAMGVAMRDERCFGPETDCCVPERFMGDTVQARLARRSFAAFGAHDRMCVGFTFALTLLRAASCAILQRYKVDLAQEAARGVGHDAVPVVERHGVACPLDVESYRFARHIVQEVEAPY